MKQFLTVVFLATLPGILSPIYGQWEKFIIEPNLSDPAIVDVADMDDDGDLDVAATGSGTDRVLWYENIGGTATNWTKHLIDTYLDGAMGLAIADMDGDFDKDLVAAGSETSKFLWYENRTGTPRIKRYIDEHLDGAGSVFVEDIDGDDDLDIVVTVSNANIILWFENVGGTARNWTKHIMDANLDGARELDVADIDDDGDPDVVTIGYFSDDVVCYKNNLPDTNWTKIIIDGSLRGPSCVRIADIDGDGDPDIAATGNTPAMHIARLVWYKNDSIEQTWTKYPISTDLNRARSLAINDIDGNGSMDILVTDNAYPPDNAADDVILFRSEDGGQTWTEESIDNNLDGANYVYIADINNDFHLDILVTATGANQIVWYKNSTTDIDPVSGKVSTFYELSQNYPNPFNARTTIEYSLTKATKTIVKIYDILGREVITLLEGNQEQGVHRIYWDGRDKMNQAVATGMYLFRIEAGEFVSTKKMVYLK
jgi:hypothetical protein